MNDIELKEANKKVSERLKDLFNEKIEELGFEAFVDFWLNNLNDSINELEDPTTDVEKYLKNLDPLEYTKDPQKLISDIQNELKRQKKEYKKIFEDQMEHFYKDNKKVKKKDSDIIKLNSIHPNNHIILNTKINNYLAAIVGTGDRAVPVSGKKEKEILTIVNIDYKDKNVDLPKSFTAYDRTVLNACISLFEAKNNCFTPDTVYRCMNGLTDREKPTPQQKGAITKSIDKMRYLFCTIDFKDEAIRRNYKVDKFTIEDNILNVQKIDIEAGGNTVIGYQFNSKPILYKYAQQSKRIITVPVKLLNTKSALSSTDEVIVIREYLLRRIETMKNTNDKSNKIVYDTIYEETGIEEKPTKQKAEKIRIAVRKILNYWKSEKYIKDYQEYKSGRAFRGIEIIY